MVASKNELSTGRIPGARSFYAKALSEAERVSLEEALQVTGIDEEIALLRVRLQQAIDEKPEDLELMFKGAALLARLIATRYGISKADTDELQVAIEHAATALSEVYPEAADE